MEGYSRHANVQNIFQIRLPVSAVQAILELQVAKLHNFARLEFRHISDYMFGSNWSNKRSNEALVAFVCCFFTEICFPQIREAAPCSAIVGMSVEYSVECPCNSAEFHQLWHGVLYL